MFRSSQGTRPAAARLNCFLLLALVTTVHGLSLQAPSRLVAESGTRVTILCEIKHRVNDSLSPEHTASDLLWYRSGSRLPPDVYTAANDTTSELSLDSADVEDSGNYSCVLGGSLDENVAVATTVLQVGTNPDFANFSCVCYNMGDMWCTWNPVDSYLPTTYEFTWRLHYDSQWSACPDKEEKGPNSCFFDFYENLGSLHRMRVVATNALGQSRQEIWFNPDTQTIPYPPEKIRVNPKSAYAIQVKWDPPTDWYATIFFLQYKLEYRSEWEPGKWSKEIANIKKQTSYTISGLHPFTRYTVRIAAMPAASHGDYWSVWAAASGHTQESAPDEGVRLFISGEIMKPPSRDVTISWTLPERRQRNGIIQGFNISWIEEGNPTNIQSINIPDGNQSLFTMKDLDLFRSYHVTVTAYNSVGSSPVSVIRIVDKTTAPGEPRITEVKAISNSSIAVTWEAPQNPNGVIMNYVLAYVDSDGSSSRSGRQWKRVEFDNTVNRYVAKDLHEFVQYEFRIQAKNIVGYGGFSKTVTEYTMEGVPSSAPVNLTLQTLPNAPSSLLASWKAPCLEDRNGIIRQYNLAFCTYHPNVNGDSANKRIGCQAKDVTKATYTVPDPQTLKSSREPLHYEITGLKANTGYAVSVSALTTAGEGPATEFVLQKTSIGAPTGRPLAIRVPKIQPSTLSLTWAMDNESDVLISHYVVGARPLNHTDCGMKFMNVTDTAVTIPNLCGYETYELTIKACSNAVIEDPCGKDSAPVYSTTEAGVPSQPMAVKAAQVTDSTIEVVWEPPERLNSPEDGMTYSVECLTERNKSMSEIAVVRSTEAIVRMLCDKSIDSEAVQVRCQVRAISARQEQSLATSTNYVLICYDEPVWPYVVIVLTVMVAIAILAFVSYKCYMCLKRSGAFDKVSYIQPIWEVKVPMQVNVYLGEKEEYDEMWHQRFEEKQEKTTVDSASVHSTDPGVVVDSARPLLTLAGQSFSMSEPGGEEGGGGGERKGARRPKSEGDEPTVTTPVLRGGGAPSPDGSRNRLSSADEYQLMAEVDGRRVLGPPGSMSSQTSGDRGEYSELSDADGLVGFKAKDDGGKTAKGVQEKRALKLNLLVPLQEGVTFHPDADVTSISVFHADVDAGRPGLAADCAHGSLVGENSDKRGGEPGADTEGSIRRSQAGDDASTRGESAATKNASATGRRTNQTQEYQPVGTFEPGGNYSLDHDEGVCTSGHSEESGIIFDMSDSEDLENTIPLLNGIPRPMSPSLGLFDQTAGSSPPKDASVSHEGLQKFPLEANGSFFLLQDSDVEQDEADLSTEIDCMVLSAQPVPDDKYVSNSQDAYKSLNSDLRQTTV